MIDGFEDQGLFPLIFKNQSFVHVFTCFREVEGLDVA